MLSKPIPPEALLEEIQRVLKDTAVRGQIGVEQHVPSPNNESDYTPPQTVMSKPATPTPS